MAENSVNPSPLRFEWDPEKARRNRQSHDVAFEEAQTVFDDPHARVMDDPDHSLDEERAIIIGYSARNRLLFVSFAARGDVIRIISARRADRLERKLYED
ncbi:MAG: BrnT family toxin [Chloroflexi bacterium]|nr:BrnT family toxin [Chloroflexota bacterium]